VVHLRTMMEACRSRYARTCPSRTEGHPLSWKDGGALMFNEPSPRVAHQRAATAARALLRADPAPPTPVHERTHKHLTPKTIARNAPVARYG
jgi:hypothetical protein